MRYQEQAFGEPTSDDVTTAAATRVDPQSPPRRRRWGLPIGPRPRRVWLGGGAGKAAPEDHLIPEGRGRDDQGDL